MLMAWAKLNSFFLVCPSVSTGKKLLITFHNTGHSAWKSTLKFSQLSSVRRKPTCSSGFRRPKFTQLHIYVSSLFILSCTDCGKISPSFFFINLLTSVSYKSSNSWWSFENFCTSLSYINRVALIWCMSVSLLKEMFIISFRQLSII